MNTKPSKTQKKKEDKETHAEIDPVPLGDEIIIRTQSERLDPLSSEIEYAFIKNGSPVADLQLLGDIERLTVDGLKSSSSKRC